MRAGCSPGSVGALRPGKWPETPPVAQAEGDPIDPGPHAPSKAFPPSHPKKQRTPDHHRPPPIAPITPMSAFSKTPGWLDWHPNPGKPHWQLPAGAVDAHCHVFGPGAEFPYPPERKYTPCDAGKAQLYALREHLGFARNVVVQATCHGSDNRALVDALRHSGGRARGVASVERSVSDEQLQALHDAGVRGVRFNFVKRLVDVTPRDELMEIAARIAKLGWHVVIYFEAADLPGLWDFFAALPTTVVVDHMGRPDVSQPVDGPDFGLFLELMHQHPHVWSKVSCPERLSLTGPPALNGERNAYADVLPFARRVVQAFPERVLWGSDWPHPNLRDHMPDDGLLVDYIAQIAQTPALRQQLLVDNRMRFYWPEECCPCARRAPPALRYPHPPGKPDPCHWTNPIWTCPARSFLTPSKAAKATGSTSSA